MAHPTARLQPVATPAAPGTRPLPKATVKLQPTQPVSSAPTGTIASAPLSTGRLSGQLDDDGEEAGVMPFAAVALVLALAVFTIELIGAQKPFMQDKTGSPSWAVPDSDYKHGNYEKIKAATGEVNLGYNFPADLPARLPIPTYKQYKDSKN
jgi:hypothetical protein